MNGIFRVVILLLFLLDMKTNLRPHTHQFRKEICSEHQYAEEIALLRKSICVVTQSMKPIAPSSGFVFENVSFQSSVLCYAICSSNNDDISSHFFYCVDTHTHTIRMQFRIMRNTFILFDDSFPAYKKSFAVTQAGQSVGPPILHSISNSYYFHFIFYL